nr:Unknown Function [uncultured bacterium]
MNPPKGTFRSRLDDDVTNPHASFPFLGGTSERPVQLQHFGMLAKMGADLLQLVASLGFIAEFEPADGGRKMKDIWRFKSIHFSKSTLSMSDERLAFYSNFNYVRGNSKSRKFNASRYFSARIEKRLLVRGF